MIKSQFKLPSIFNFIQNMERPRIIKTHLTYDLLPKGVREKNVKVGTVECITKLFLRIC